jgi:hypothetical protein
VSWSSFSVFLQWSAWNHVAIIAQKGFMVRFLHNNIDITVTNGGKSIFRVYFSDVVVPIYQGNFGSSIYDIVTFADPLYYEGFLDNVQIWRKALNLGEVQYLSSYGNASIGIKNPTLPPRDSDGDGIGDYCGTFSILSDHQITAELFLILDK